MQLFSLNPQIILSLKLTGQSPWLTQDRQLPPLPTVAHKTKPSLFSSNFFLLQFSLSSQFVASIAKKSQALASQKSELILNLISTSQTLSLSLKVNPQISPTWVSLSSSFTLFHMAITAIDLQTMIGGRKYKQRQNHKLKLCTLYQNVVDFFFFDLNETHVCVVFHQSFNRQINKWLYLAGLYSLRSKLTKLKVQGVFWPLLQSLGGLLAFFPK